MKNPNNKTIFTSEQEMNFPIKWIKVNARRIDLRANNKR